MSSKLFTFRTCILPSAITRRQKAGCIAMALAGLTLSITCLYRGGLYIINDVIPPGPILSHKTATRFTDTMDMIIYDKSGYVHGALALLFTITGLELTRTVLINTFSIFNIIKYDTRCCHIIRQTAMYGLVTPIHTVGSLGVFIGAYLCYSRTKSSLMRHTAKDV